MRSRLPRRAVLTACGAAVIVLGGTGTVLLRDGAAPDVLQGREPLRTTAVAGPGTSRPGDASPGGAAPPVRSASPSPTRNPFQLPPTGQGDAAPDAPSVPPSVAPSPPPGARNPFVPLVTGRPSGTSPGGEPGQGPPPAGPGDGTERRAVLGRGDSGPDVRALQQRLRDRGVRIAVDGIFGPQTERAVRAFQARSGVAVDGLAGPATLTALR